MSPRDQSPGSDARSPGIDVLGLVDSGADHDGSQLGMVAARVADFIGSSERTLEIALYDVRLPDPVGSVVAGAFREASDRGVAVRLVYNSGTERPESIHPPPATRPDILESLPIAAKPISGVPDLMHHKYMVRDGAAVWTGSANWSIDSWTRQENVLATLESDELAGAFRANFEELWRTGRVSRSGNTEPEPVRIGGATVRAWFTPGHGPELAQRIATRIGMARHRVRIASPVITSGPILGTLAELGESGRRSIAAGVIDEPQSDRVFEQWSRTRSSWKAPILAKVLESLDFSGKPSTPWTPESLHDFMHAKVTVADDTVFLGSFNLSRSGEQNAENMVEIEDSGTADLMADMIDSARARYPATTPPSVVATSGPIVSRS